MAGEKVKQLSQMFDAPQYAQQFIELARKTGKCRDLRIRAKCEITDAKGKPVINQKTKIPKVGWVEYAPMLIAQNTCALAQLSQKPGRSDIPASSPPSSVRIEPFPSGSINPAMARPLAAASTT